MDPRPRQSDPHEPPDMAASLDLPAEDGSRFTPGPWGITFSPIRDEGPHTEALIHAPGGEGRRWSVVTLDHNLIDWQENALLIASAPDLAIALLKALSSRPCQIRFPRHREGWEDAAIAALKRARLPGMQTLGMCTHCSAEGTLELLNSEDEQQEVADAKDAVTPSAEDPEEPEKRRTEDPQSDDTDEGPAHPFPDESWIGCPHCEKPIDIWAQVARARRDVGEYVLSLIFNGVPAEKIAHPLELLNHECMTTEDAVRRSSRPLSYLDIYHHRRGQSKKGSNENPL